MECGGERNGGHDQIPLPEGSPMGAQCAPMGTCPGANGNPDISIIFRSHDGSDCSYLLVSPRIELLILARFTSYHECFAFEVFASG